MIQDPAGENRRPRKSTSSRSQGATLIDRRFCSRVGVEVEGVSEIVTSNNCVWEAKDRLYQGLHLHPCGRVRSQEEAARQRDTGEE